MIFPLSAQAGVFSVFSDFLSSSKDEPIEMQTDQNIQTMPLLKGDLNFNGNAKGGGDITIVEGSALAPEVGPLGTLSQIEERNHEISIYIVREGDTLSQIAKMFDVSINTIVWANDIKAGKIREGQSLIILPISGIVHTVKSGDTVRAIALKYKADKDEILAYNGLSENEPLAIGDKITIPDAEISTPVNSSLSKFSSSGSGSFIRPTKGVKTQGLHGYNGIDIGAPIGTPIIASREGSIIISKTSGWNGGYGKYVVIKHKNGVQTLYAHMNTVNVVVGESVSEGEMIGTVGNTGKSTGPHLHFEVRGAKNPF